ncbi:hypothetical protein EJ04DRAFT_591941 [Polyplosphaeria fusca]|uniref:Aminoglycoside phosphotransferase domain-containing protein n=1 Tax=Polyplosphaeria fusca TaxID=682080 RepID=A0A9P4UWX2_9PLEO|nr:hypothetical protein EJ04DRAFT_591941 [Polyplosphaeria fusca]
MEDDEAIELIQDSRGKLGEDRLNESQRSGHLCAWVSTFHYKRLPCWLADQNLYHGLYNAGIKVKFGDGTTWLLRFPRVGKVHPRYSNEKVAMEVAVFLLQLFKLDFDHIDWRSRYFLSFSSTTEYFQYVVNQNWEQVVRQRNSTYGRYGAMAKYRSFKALKSIITDFIHDEYDRTKFKIVCDDLGLANLIVKSREDLTVIGVVDLEWSYIGPAQLFGSAPWWLLMDRPTNDAELSALMRWSEHSGAMWLHMLLTTGFNDPCSYPFTKLIQHIGADEWESRKRDVAEDEVEAFGVKKMMQLKQYRKDLEVIKANKALVDTGQMRKEDFVAWEIDVFHITKCLGTGDGISELFVSRGLSVILARYGVDVAVSNPACGGIVN